MVMVSVLHYGLKLEFIMSLSEKLKKKINKNFLNVFGR